jgi:hypothetical protein
VASINRKVPTPMQKDESFLLAALMGYAVQLRAVQGKIEEIQTRLGRSQATIGKQGAMPIRRPRIMSAEARKRIADAQTKRWAAYRAAQR